MKGNEIITYAVRGDMPEPEQIRESCHRLSAERSRGGARAPRRRSFSAIAAAAVLAVLLGTTALAYGSGIAGVIRQFMFGESSASQVESIDGGAAIGFEIKNRSSFAEYTKGSFVAFDTLDAARRAAPFALKEPAFIPENAALESVSVVRRADKTFGYDAHIEYTVELQNGAGLLTLFQYYAGPGAYIELQTVETLEKIMVGGIEATVVSYGNTPHIYWMKDEVLLELFSACYDLDTLIKIAASVE